MLTGALTMDELMEIVGVVERSAPAGRPHVDGHRPASNCLALHQEMFEAVIAELERRLHIPLFLESLSCRSATDLVTFVNIQATSAA